MDGRRKRIKDISGKDMAVKPEALKQCGRASRFQQLRRRLMHCLSPVVAGVLDVHTVADELLPLLELYAMHAELGRAGNTAGSIATSGTDKQGMT